MWDTHAHTHKHSYHGSYTSERGQGSAWNWLKETGDVTRRSENKGRKRRGRTARRREKKQGFKLGRKGIEEGENREENKLGQRGQRVVLVCM